MTTRLDNTSQSENRTALYLWKEGRTLVRTLKHKGVGLGGMCYTQWSKIGQT